MSILVMPTRCWSCQFGDHFNPPREHTWMDKEDAEHAGHPWPLPDATAEANPCQCTCSIGEKGADGCVVARDGGQAEGGQ